MKTFISSYPHLTVLLLVVLLGTSCKKPAYTSKIDSPILIEVYKTNDGKIRLKANTVKIYGCANYSIDYKVRNKGNKKTIIFTHVNEGGGFCLTSFGAAEAVYYIYPIKYNEYDLVFKVNGKATHGKLTISPLKLELKEEGNVKLK